ncbi:MAG: LysR family transcriptional regulator [Nocardia sp.]|uniref:LysR family transcriptional regulator n=1 Tax=Nocardia sp. TaxID=1821 RepID=UPI0026295CCC|nr:LysR family transcriptional regulator [Nocardia sp.]MCU1643349.1 LysR family transcriptional regulator [Nocardia sp.]
MELRDIEIFLTLAQELHFGRTAQRLHLSQARVSQSIKNQERRIGGRLVDRSNPRDVRLTLLGHQLASELKPAYDDILAAIEHARQVAAGISGVLRVAMIGYNAYDYQPFWDAFRSRFPGWELRVRSSEFGDQFGPLHRDEADIVIAWLPIEEPGLTVGPIISVEPMVAIMPDSHELADEKNVSLEVFGDRGVFSPTAPMPDYWEDAVSPFYTPKGRTIDRVTPISTLEDILTTAGMSGAFTSGMSHIARYYQRPGITYLPITDSRLVRWAPVWRSDSESERIRAFARIVRELGHLEQS